jgi:calpain, invertebrate
VLGDVERKLLIDTHEKFKESVYASEDCSALLFKWNPTEGPFILIPSSDGEERLFPYRLTIYSNNPVEMVRLD